MSAAKITVGYCGLIDYKYVITPVNLALFELNQASLAFVAYSNNLDQVGVYQAALTVTLSEFPAVTKTFPFKVTVNDPCKSATLAFNQTMTTVQTTKVKQVNVDGTANVATLLVPAVYDSLSVS